jgi:hypothetical protein
MKWRIYDNADHTQHGMHGESHFDIGMLDVDTNEPMQVVKEFEASSYNEAQQVYNNHWGWGLYTPMKDDD